MVRFGLDETGEGEGMWRGYRRGAALRVSLIGCAVCGRMAVLARPRRQLVQSMAAVVDGVWFKGEIRRLR